MNTNITEEGKVWTEADWNEYSPKRLEEKKDDSEPAQIYLGSKVRVPSLFTERPSNLSR
jgi:hypothetical protein